MQVNVQELIEGAGLKDPLYPGKKLVKKYQVQGDHKSHCVVFDWHHSDVLRVELKAGLNGKTPALKDLKHYPVSFQAATYLDIAMDETNDNEDEDEEGSKGKSGGGGKKPALKKAEDLSLNAFGKMAEGAVALTGEIEKFVIMGKELAKEAYAQAFENLKEQLGQAKVMAMDLMKGVSDIIKKATPGGGLEARGDETIKYKYDSERTAGMFGGMNPG